MKILFSGCSFTYGAEIEKTERFSYLVSQQLNAEEINIAEGGRGNLSTALLTITEAEKHRPDYIVVNITFPHRSFCPLDLEFSYSLEQYQRDNKIVKIVDGEYHEQVFRLTPQSMHGDNLPLRKQVENTFHMYRNDRLTFVETISVINMLKVFSEQSGIPICMFSGPRMRDVPIEINNVLVEGTMFEYPPKIPQWVDFGEAGKSYWDVGVYFDDMMPERHPGPIANKYVADILTNRIRKDLKL